MLKQRQHNGWVTRLLLFGLGCLLAVSGGCGRVDRSTVITVWEQMDPQEQVLFDRHIEDFRRIYPQFDHFEIQRVHYRVEDLQTQFQTAALAYGGPNLIYGPADKIGPYKIMGLLLPVSDLLPQSEIDRFRPETLPILSDQVWGLPDHVGNHLTLVANLALVDSMATDTETWVRQLRELTKDLDGDGKIDQYGLVFNLIEPFWLVPWLGGYGGWVMDDEGQPTLNTEAMVQALDFLGGLKKERVVPMECDYPMADTIFKEGRAAYIINGPWSWEGYREMGLEIGLANIPQVSTSGLWPTPMTSAKCYSINRYLDPATRECTAALLAHLTSTQVQIELARELSVQPGDIIAGRDSFILTDPVLRASRRQIEKGRLMPIIPEMRAIWDAMRPAYQMVMNGEMGSREAAEAMQQRAALSIERMRE